jgi:hypothetical protein
MGERHVASRWVPRPVLAKLCSYGTKIISVTSHIDLVCQQARSRCLDQLSLHVSKIQCCFQSGAEGSKNEADVSKELAVKHPLQNKWAWWFYKNDKSKSWEANLRLITTFDTVSFSLFKKALFLKWQSSLTASSINSV